VTSEPDQVLKRFDELNTWRQGDQRAPHKPLLVLYALGRWQQGKADVTYADAEPDLTALLREFGPPRKSDHPEQPFWRLQRDGVWTVQAPADMPMKTGDDIPRVTALRSHDVRAGFSADVRAALTADPALVAGIASRILERHFPESLHQDILNAIGLRLDTATKKTRDPAFRQRVLKAYEWRCAVCGFDVKLGTVAIALDAAHIRWHQAGGPDAENNGLALCVLHHKTFDLGAFTVADGVLLVSDQANGTSGFQEALLAYHGKPIRPPQHPDWKPEPGHLEWHGREVFKGEARHRG
jgi:putative restriction endonuclease